jgi:branched-chain amino acid transport system substrate-binding protein
MAIPRASRLTRRSLLQSAAGAVLALLGSSDLAEAGGTNAVQLGVVVDTSGAGGVYGAPVLKGMLLAASKINAGGGVNGRALSLDIWNGGSNPARIAALVQRAAHDRSVVAMLGPTLSSEAVKVDPLAQSAGLPVLAVSNTVPGLTAIGSYIFRLPLGDAQIIPVVLRTTESRLHFKTAALLYDRLNAATAGAGEIFRSEAAKIGLDLMATETFPSGTTRFGTYLDAIKAARPDVILVSALAQDAVSILTQRLQAGIPASTPVIGANGLNTPAIISGAGSAAEGVIVGTAYDPDTPTARNRHFKTAYAQRYHQTPDTFAAQGYDGVYTVVTALRNARTTDDRRALRAALSTLKNVPSVLSPSGHFSMSVDREANLSPTVRIVRNGRFERFS